MSDYHLTAVIGSDATWVEDTVWRPKYTHLKRLLDITAATVGLTVLSPLMLLLGCLVKLTSRGPMLFKQERVGLDGRVFEILKLRTMCSDAEKRSGPVWAGRNDPRITPIGYFLRRSHLDEIPQLINVLMGDMSLVGPRPERPFFVEQFMSKMPHYAERMGVKPGITGLAQIYHKYDETVEDVAKKLVYDVSYAKRYCFSLDMTILIATMQKLTGDQQAN